MATQNKTSGATTFDAPNAGDSFFIFNSSADITGNTDSSGVNTMVEAEIARSYTGVIATAASPWKAAFSTELLYMADHGALHWESNSLDTETTALVRNRAAGSLYVYGSGIITLLEHSGAYISIANGTTVTTADLQGSGTVFLLDSGTGPAVVTCNVRGVKLYNQRPITTLNVYSGEVTLDGDDAGAVNAIGTINVHGGLVKLVDPGTISNLNWYGGVVDASQVVRALTITDSIFNMTLPGVQAVKSHDRITYTNATTEKFSDGRP